MRSTAELMQCCGTFDCLNKLRSQISIEYLCIAVYVHAQ